MRRIPFSLLKGTIEEARVKRLVQDFKVRPELANTLLNHSIVEPEDVLRIPELLRIATPQELWQLLRDDTFSPSPEAISQSQISLDKTSGTFTGSYTTANGRIRFFISDNFGELISAETSGNRPVEYSSLRFLGCRIFQLSNLTPHQVGYLLARLHHRVAVRAGLLWREKDQAQPLRVLSQILRILQSFTFRSARATTSQSLTGEPSVSPPSGTSNLLPGGISPPAGTISPGLSDDDQVNGCGPSGPLGSLVPDFDFRDCCNEHDRCYNKGCTECDRLQCDLNLYTCIVDKGASEGRDYTELAALYYFAVRTFGSNFFNYCRERDPYIISAGGLLGIAIAVAGAILGSALGGPAGGVAGAALGAAVGVAASYGLGLILCQACEKIVQFEQDFTNQVVTAIRNCWSQYKKCRKRRHWWQRLLCRAGAILLIIVCTIVLGLLLVVVRVVTLVLKIVTC